MREPSGADSIQSGAQSRCSSRLSQHARISPAGAWFAVPSSKWPISWAIARPSNRPLSTPASAASNSTRSS